MRRLSMALIAPFLLMSICFGSVALDQQEHLLLLVPLALGVVLLTVMVDRRLVVNPRARTVSVEARLLGFAVRKQRWPFGEVAAVDVERRGSSDEAYPWYLVLQVDGQGSRRVPFRAMRWAKRLEAERQADRLREAVGLASSAEVGPAPPAEGIGIGATQDREAVPGGLVDVGEEGIRTTLWHSNEVRLPQGWVVLLQTRPGRQAKQYGALAHLGLKGNLVGLTIDTAEMRDLDDATVVTGLAGAAAQHFTVVASEPQLAHAIFGSAAAQALDHWVARYPLPRFSLVTQRHPAPLTVVVSPTGLSLGLWINLQDPELTERFHRLADGLVAALRDVPQFHSGAS